MLLLFKSGSFSGSDNSVTIQTAKMVQNGGAKNSPLSMCLVAVRSRKKEPGVKAQMNSIPFCRTLLQETLAHTVIQWSAGISCS